MKVDFKFVGQAIADYLLWTLVCVFCGILVALLISEDRGTFVLLSLVETVSGVMYGVPLTMVMILFRHATKPIEKREK